MELTEKNRTGAFIYPEAEGDTYKGLVCIAEPSDKDENGKDNKCTKCDIRHNVMCSTLTCYTLCKAGATDGIDTSLIWKHITNV